MHPSFYGSRSISKSLVDLEKDEYDEERVIYLEDGDSEVIHKETPISKTTTTNNNEPREKSTLYPEANIVPRFRSSFLNKKNEVFYNLFNFLNNNYYLIDFPYPTFIFIRQSSLMT